MKKIFTKEEAQNLKFADAVHVWMKLKDVYRTHYSEHWNAFIWKIYGTRLDLNGLSKKDWGLTWDTYGTKWLLSTPINSYDNKNNITIDNIKSYLRDKVDVLLKFEDGKKLFHAYIFNCEHYLYGKKEYAIIAENYKDACNLLEKHYKKLNYSYDYYMDEINDEEKIHEFLYGRTTRQKEIGINYF